jgi:hypothetical protein
MTEQVECNYESCKYYDEQASYNCSNGYTTLATCGSYQWYNHSKDFIVKPAESDAVNSPPHYTQYPLEVKDMIKLLVEQAYGPDGYKAHCFACEIKYRMRAGFKDDPQVDIKKAMKYFEFRKET